MKRYKLWICFGTLVVVVIMWSILMRSNETFRTFNENHPYIFWTSNEKNDALKNYSELPSCSSSFKEHTIMKTISAMNDIKLVNRNPNKPSGGVELSDDDIIARCKYQKRSRLYDAAFDHWSLISPSPPNYLQENNTSYKVLQQKYDRRVLEEDGCLLPKGMWGHPFNSRCTIVTMATIGNYQPNDLILDWGSGCGHQATTMTRLTCNFSRLLHLYIRL